MKKITLLLLILFSTLALAACNQLRRTQPTLTGRYIAGNYSHILVVDFEHGASPIIMGNRSGNDTLFENLQTGDKIQVSFSGQVILSNPGRMWVYGYELLERGSIEDIPPQVYSWLMRMGHITSTSAQETIPVYRVDCLYRLRNPNPFMLTISVAETTLPRGENFRVNVELKNNSGECLEITYSILFWPSIPEWAPFGGIAIDPPEPQTRIFEANSTIQNIGIWGDEGEEWLIGDDLPPGKHELQFRATFWLQDNKEPIVIWSNVILLTVQ